jgi:hypothetical protein
MTTLTVKELRDVLNALPEYRDDDPICTYELEGGLREYASHVDTDCFDHTVVDINFTDQK